MINRPAKIQDVARVAGVSTATVSRAISRPDLLSKATQDAVFDAIQKTGYRVNRTARNLRRRQAGAVLVLVPNLGNPFFSQILSGISAGFENSDFSVLIADSHHMSDRTGQVIEAFVDGRIDGMISLDGSFSIDELNKCRSVANHNRIVFACEWVKDTDLSVVFSDNAGGATMAVQHLYDLGHRKIAHITGPQDNVLTQVRRTALLEARQKLGLEIRPEWIIRGNFSLSSGYQAAKEILALPTAERPTAVFCASDEMALGLMSALHQAGINVPHDISVVGFDDIEQAAYNVPALTTIRQNRGSLGEQAAAMLLGRLKSKDQSAVPHKMMVDVELVVRASTAAPKP